MSQAIRHERFAKLKAAGKTNREAYKMAGYNASNDNSMDATASALLRHPKVVETIEQERKKLSEDPDFSPEAIAARLKSYEIALANEGSLKAAADVAMQEAKLAGLLIDRTQDISKLTDLEVLEELEKLRKQA